MAREKAYKQGEDVIMACVANRESNAVLVYILLFIRSYSTVQHAGTLCIVAKRYILHLQQVSEQLEQVNRKCPQGLTVIQFYNFQLPIPTLSPQTPTLKISMSGITMVSMLSMATPDNCL